MKVSLCEFVTEKCKIIIKEAFTVSRRRRIDIMKELLQEKH